MYDWVIARTRQGIEKTTDTELKSLNELTTVVRNGLQREPDKSFPVIAYYSVTRMVSEKDSPVSFKHGTKQLDVYDDALEAETKFQDFFKWFREREDIENELLAEKKSNMKNGSIVEIEIDKELESVRKAIYTFLDGFSDLRVKRTPTPRLTLKKNGVELVVNQLSDGEKCLLTMIGDIARRLAMANPGSKNPVQEGKGIVLIDELELHLHPLWQRNIIGNLCKAFPNCQFIITTHSPQIVGSAKNAEIIKFSEGEAFEGILNPEKSPYGKDSSSVLSEDMDAFGRDVTAGKLIDSLHEAIDGNKKDEAVKLYENLKNEIVDQIELQHARVLMKRRKML